MKRVTGFKVVVTLPDGTKSHFIANLPNNLSGAKTAIDEITRQYEAKGLLISPRANFFDSERDYVLPPPDHMADVPALQRCWCGWKKRGECASCPDDLSFADNKRSRITQ